MAGGATHGQTGEFPLAGGRTSQPANTDWSLPSGQAADHARTLVPLSLRQLLQIFVNYQISGDIIPTFKMEIAGK